VLFWGLVASFWIGNVMLVILNLPLIGIWVRILTIPRRVLMPAILMFMAIGVYSINNNVFDIWVMILFGVVGYFMSAFRFEAAPLLLGFILGPPMEQYLTRALLSSGGDPAVFVQRPISASLLVISVLVLLLTVWGALRRRRKAAARDEARAAGGIAG